MKKLLLLTLIPFMSFAGNFVAGPDSPTVYSNQEECEKFYQAKCFDKGTEFDHDLMSLVKVQVDDNDKPIYSFAGAKEVCVDVGSEKEPLLECHMNCEEGWELFNEKECRHLDGYEQKEIEQLQLDPKKVADRAAQEEAAKAAEEAAQEAKRLEEERIAGERAAIKAKIEASESPAPEDIKAALKLLLE